MFFFKVSPSPFSPSSSVAMVTLSLSFSPSLRLSGAPPTFPSLSAAGWMVAIETDLFKRRAKKLSYSLTLPNALALAPSLPLSFTCHILLALPLYLPASLSLALPQLQASRPTLLFSFGPRHILWTHTRTARHKDAQTPALLAHTSMEI